MGNSAYGLIVRFVHGDGKADGFNALVAELQERIRSGEPDTLLYDFCAVPRDSNVRVLIEIYRSRAAFDFHERQSHTRDFLSERAQYLSMEPEVTELDVLSRLPCATDRKRF
jgi:quinol monooxygenase YgiN